MSNEMLLILWGIGGYLLGSIPFGMLLCLMFGYGNIRNLGSGNIGATNVLRVTKSKLLALLTVIFDAAKAGVIAFIALKMVDVKTIMLGNVFCSLNVFAALLSGTMAVIGHNFPVWLKFKGGKGVAASFGLILATSPMTAWTALAIWIFVAAVFRYSSFAAIMSALAVPFISFFYNDLIYTIFYTYLALLLLVRHRSNIVRLYKGEESKISFSKSDKKMSKKTSEKAFSKTSKQTVKKTVRKKGKK